LNGIFSDAVAHDIWSVGVVLYDWYIYNNIDDAFNDETNDLSNKTETQINLTLDTLPDFQRAVLKLLLTIDRNTRLENWSAVLELLKNYSKQIECENNKSIVLDNTNTIIIHDKNKNWCISKDEISETIDGASFVNPYTNNTVYIDQLNLQKLGIELPRKYKINVQKKPIITGDSPLHISKDDYLLVIEWLINTLFDLNKMKLIFQVISLYIIINRLIKFNINYKLLGLACIKIALFSYRYKNMDTLLLQFAQDDYTQQQLNDAFNVILKTVNYNVDTGKDITAYIDASDEETQYFYCVLMLNYSIANDYYDPNKLASLIIGFTQPNSDNGRNISNEIKDYVDNFERFKVLEKMYQSMYETDDEWVW